MEQPAGAEQEDKERTEQPAAEWKDKKVPEQNAEAEPGDVQVDFQLCLPYLER